jgi:hypothetical protein
MHQAFEIGAEHLLSRHEFDLLRPPARSRVELRRGRPEDLERATALAYESISGPMAPPTVVHRVLAINPNNILLFWRKGRIVGTWSMLMLTARGLEALLTGDLALMDPRRDCLASPTQGPAAIYIWAVVAPGIASEGIRHVSAFLRQPLYADANLYAKPATLQGRQLSESLGFVTVSERQAQTNQDCLLRYIRLENRCVAPAEAA